MSRYKSIRSPVRFQKQPRLKPKIPSLRREREREREMAEGFYTLQVDVSSYFVWPPWNSRHPNFDTSPLDNSCAWGTQASLSRMQAGSCSPTSFDQVISAYYFELATRKSPSYRSLKNKRPRFSSSFSNNESPLVDITHRKFYEYTMTLFWILTIPLRAKMKPPTQSQELLHHLSTLHIYMTKALWLTIQMEILLLSGQ